ncbi:MAG: 16S rRNA (cytidine(1402)-2'-O)-methyltransferase [Verrucomicrobiota bacterium]|nr:16S rRNA (cytidine(1402)-2'-O)-methyltransferase [Verrucomicrobiota bacterium]
MLYLVATPIGTLSDITLRAVETLKKVDAILCEDSRRSAILLKHYEIEKPLYPHHKFNEKKNLEKVLERLRNGEEIALISDAGTPCINDPGAVLVQACIAEGIPFTAIPGPCSPIVALLLSGFDTARFQCIGFLPKKSEETLRSALTYRGTTIAFESPERLIDTLEDLTRLDPERKIAVAREMTKTYEECIRGTAHEVLAHYRQKGVKGEVCLLIGEGKFPTEEYPLDELIELLQESHGLSLKEAIKLAAKLLKQPKSDIYRAVHANEN